MSASLDPPQTYLIVRSEEAQGEIMSYCVTAQSFARKRSLFQILKLAFPLILTQSLQMTLGLVDTFVAGQLGSEALAAMAIANGLFWG